MNWSLVNPALTVVGSLLAALMGAGIYYLRTFVAGQIEVFAKDLAAEREKRDTAFEQAREKRDAATEAALRVRDDKVDRVLERLEKQFSELDKKLFGIDVLLKERHGRA